MIVKYISGLEEILPDRYRLLDVDIPADLPLITDSYKAIYLNESGGEIYGAGIIRAFENGEFVLKIKKTGEIILEDCDKIQAVYKSKTIRAANDCLKCTGLIYYQYAYTEEKGLLYYEIIRRGKNNGLPEYKFIKLKSCLCDKISGNFYAIKDYKTDSASNYRSLSIIKSWIEEKYKYFYPNILYTELVRSNICLDINPSDISTVIDMMIKENGLVTKFDGNKNIYYEVIKPNTKKLTKQS